MSYATTGELAAANAKIASLEKQVQENKKEIEEIKARLGIMVINHKFDETDVQPAFSKENTISTGIQGVGGYEPKFAVIHDSGRTGDIVEACYIAGGQVHMRLFSNFKSRKAIPSADVVYFKTKF